MDSQWPSGWPSLVLPDVPPLTLTELRWNGCAGSFVLLSAYCWGSCHKTSAAQQSDADKDKRGPGETNGRNVGGMGSRGGEWQREGER